MWYIYSPLCRFDGVMVAIFEIIRSEQPWLTNDIRLHELHCAIHSFYMSFVVRAALARNQISEFPSTVLKWCLQAVVIPCFSETTATLLLSAGMNIADATFHVYVWIKELHIPRCLQAISILCFSEAMAKLLLSDAGLLDGVAFHPWMKEFHTPKCLQEVVIQSFWEVMAKLWLAEAEMAVLWLWQVQSRGSAAFHHWLKGWNIPRCLRGWITQYFSEVMGKLLLAAGHS